MGGGDVGPAPAIPVDPNLATEQQQAQADLVAGLGKQSQGDMASLMALYGTKLAMAGNNNRSPLAPNPAGGRVVV